MGQGDEDRVARDESSDASSDALVALELGPEGAIAPTTGRRRSAPPPPRTWARPVGRGHTRRVGTRRAPAAAVAAPTRGADATSDILHPRAEVASTARRCARGAC